MKYEFEERLEIGRQIYDDELTKFEASERYGISIHVARDYMRLYRDKNKLQPKNMKYAGKSPFEPDSEILKLRSKLEEKTKEELIDELIKAKIALDRRKQSSGKEKIKAKRETGKKAAKEKKPSAKEKTAE